MKVTNGKITEFAKQRGYGTVTIPTTPGDAPIPEDYAALGLTNGYNPPTADEARIFVTGLTGEGKTTFVSSIPDSVLLDFEGGAEGVVKRRANYFNIKKAAQKCNCPVYEQFLKIHQKLVDDAKAGKKIAKRVIFDTLDELVDWEGRHLAEEKSTVNKTIEDIVEYGQKGHGYALVRSRVWKKIAALEDVGYTWAVVGHLAYAIEYDPISNKEVTRIRPLAFKTMVGKILAHAELHVSIYSHTTKERVEVEKTNRAGKAFLDTVEKDVTRWFLYTRPTEAKTIEGKRRGVPELPGRIEVPMIDGWGVFKEAYVKAVEKSKKQNGE